MTGKAWSKRLPAALAALVVLLCASRASAAVRRYAVIVGNDRGDASDVGLRYAETDAQRVYDVLKDLGSSSRPTWWSSRQPRGPSSIGSC
jgi:hypothetical protein